MSAARALSGGALTVEALLAMVGIVDVVRALGGGELRHGRIRAFWRDGTGLNVSINVQRHTWKDFVTGEGGGAIQLIQKVLGCSAGEAYRWLADLAGLPLQPTASLSREQRWRNAERWRRAEEKAERVGWWLASRIEQLEQQKRQCNGLDGPWDEKALSEVAPALHLLRTMDAHSLLQAWEEACRFDPEGTRQLEGESRWVARALAEVGQALVNSVWLSAPVREVSNDAR